MGVKLDLSLSLREGRSYIEGVWKQGSEDNIYTKLGEE
jgi:hypothetical protein